MIGYIRCGIMDSEPILVHTTKSDSLIGIVNDMLMSIQYKLIGMMMIVFIVLSSDVFINRVLASFTGAVDYKQPTSWGVVLQMMFLAIALIGADVMIRQKIV